MSNISPLVHARTFTPPVLPSAPAPAHGPALETGTRGKRSLEPESPSSWTLPALPTVPAEAVSSADRALQTGLGSQALRQATDRRIHLAANTSIFPLFDAYRRSFNTPELQSWFLSKGMALSTVVVKPDSVTGSVTRDGGGAGSTLSPLFKTTKVVAPFGAKAFRVLEKGVSIVSGFLNPLDGTADLLTGAARGIFSLPKLLDKVPKPLLLTTLGSVEEKMRTCLGVSRALNQPPATPSLAGQRATHHGHNYSVPVQAVQIGTYWYATDPTTHLPIGTPLDGFKPLNATAA